MRGTFSRAEAALLLVSVVLLVLPLTARKPGTPATLKADEPAYYLGALSLVHDLDFRADTRDFERLFRDFPYAAAQNLIVMSPDGWHTLYYGKPYIFSLFAAPFVLLLGTNGIVFFNMAMLLLMVGMGYNLLRRYNGETVSALFSFGFFVFSNAYLYVWWLHPEIFNMFAAMGCLYFGLPREDQDEAALLAADSRPPGRFGWSCEEHLVGSRMGLCLSALVLTAGAYNKPILAVCGLPVLVALLRARAWRNLLVYASAGLVGGLLWVGLSLGLTGKPSAYLVGDRAGFVLVDPAERLIEPVEVTPGAKKEERESAGWFWIFDALPDTTWNELVESTKYFLIGRHTGLFVYQPFSLLALLLFVGTAARRSLLRWSILVAAALVAFFFLFFINFNWHGGGGFVGNRYFVMATPLLIFLVGRIPFQLVVVPFYAFAGLLLGPLLISPQGLVVISPTLQAHIRGPLFERFPLEHSLREIPGYTGKIAGELYVRGLGVEVMEVDDDLWITGGHRVQIYLEAVRPLRELSLRVSSPVEGNPSSWQVGDETLTALLGKTEQRLVFHPRGPAALRQARYPPHSTTFIDVYLYRIDVFVERGQLPQNGQPFYFRGATLSLPEDEQKF